MSPLRLALVIANAVTSPIGAPGVGRSLVRRTADSIASELAKLPGTYAFTPRTLVDEPPNRVLTLVDQLSSRCTKAEDIFLLYYFGHGRLIEDQLEFMHRGTNKHPRDFLAFQRLLDRVKSNNPRNVIFVIDCCYAGAAAEIIETSLTRTYNLMACTTPATRARYEGASGNPIGTFTGAFLEGLYSPKAASITDDSISVKSLFDFVARETKSLTQGKQKPYMFGDGQIKISKYVERPFIKPGVSEKVHFKSAYSKILAVARTIGNKNFDSIRDLYTQIVYQHRESFLTPYKRPDGSIAQQLAKWTVLRKYVRFLRTIGAIDGERLSLTSRGLHLIDDLKNGYNYRLLTLIDDFLSRNGSSREEVRTAMQRILQRRGLPTRQNVILELSFTKGYRIDQTILGILLDMCGYIGVFGMPKRRDQVYFPWSEAGRTPYS